MPAVILSCILVPTRLGVGVYLPRLILKITAKVAAMSRVMMVSRTPMTSPTYSDCDCSCTVCTLDCVVPGLAGWVEGLASVVTGSGEAVLLGVGGDEEGSVLKGFSSNRSE
jgi:hypothetical protein